MRRFWPNWRIRASVVRRTLAVYVVSVPATFLLVAAVAYGSLRQDLEADARARLLDAARLYGLVVFSRLTHADQVLEQAAASPLRGSDKFHPQMDPESPLTAVRFVRADAAEEERGGNDEQGDEQTRARQLVAVAEETIGRSPLRE